MPTPDIDSIIHDFDNLDNPAPKSAVSSVENPAANQPNTATVQSATPIILPDKEIVDTQQHAAVILMALVLGVIFSVGLSVLLRLKKSTGTTPIAMGWRWMSWVVPSYTALHLTKFFTEIMLDNGVAAGKALAIWIVSTPFLAIIAFTLGALFAFIKGKSKDERLVQTDTDSDSLHQPDVVHPSNHATTSSPTNSHAPVTNQPIATNPPPPITDNIQESPPQEALNKPTQNQAENIIHKGDGSSDALEDWAYGKVSEELEADTPDKSLWTKAFVQASGDDKQTRVLYIQLRVAKLIQAEAAKQAEIKKSAEEVRKAEEETRRLAARKQEIASLKVLGRLSKAKQLLLHKHIQSVPLIEASPEGKEFLRWCYEGELHKVKEVIAKNPLFLAVADTAGNTGLHYATKAWQLEVAKYLVEQGVNPLVKNQAGAVPLVYGESIEDLMRFKFSKKNENFLSWCSLGFLHNIQEAVDENALFLVVSANGGNTGLHCAVMANQVEVVRYFIDKGVSPLMKNQDGKTPLGIARQQKMPIAAYMNP